MKIVILSDTHDNVPNLNKIVLWMIEQKITIGIHCGDITSLSTLKEGLGNFSGTLHVVFGNADADEFETAKSPFNYQPQIKTWGELGEIELAGKKIAFLHNPDLARHLAESQKYDIVFYGHTHKPWKENCGKTKLVNPGNVAGIFYKPTFAVYDTKKDQLTLQIIEKLHESQRK